MSDMHTIGEYTANPNVGTVSIETDAVTRSSQVTANVGESAGISAVYKGAGATVETVESYLYATNQYGEIGIGARKLPADANNLAEFYIAADASGATGSVELGLLRGDFSMAGFDSVGASTATFTATNAPAVISPKKWLKVKIGGTVGYIPWFST